VWEQGDEVWDGEDGDSPYPLGVLPPKLALDWEWDSDEDMDPQFWKPLKRTSIEEIRQHVQRPK
jgi:hypothetical protein